MLVVLATWSKWRLFWILAFSYAAIAELASLPTSDQQQCAADLISNTCPSLHTFAIYNLRAIFNKIAAGDIALLLKALLFIGVIWEAAIWLCDENTPTQANQDDYNGDTLVIERQ